MLNSKYAGGPGDVIRMMRIERGLTQEQLSKGICNITTLSRIERGEVVNPHDKTMNRIIERLGADEFYNRFVTGCVYEKHTHKEYLKNCIIDITKSGHFENLEGVLLEFRDCIEDEEGEDMQFYLAVQGVWYKMNKVSGVMEMTSRYKDIYEMTRDLPALNADIKKVARETQLNMTEVIAINNLGLALIHEKRYDLAVRTLLCLFLILTDKAVQTPCKKIQLARLCSNVSIAAMGCGDLKLARKFITYADDYKEKSNDMTLITLIKRIKININEDIGEQKLADVKRRELEEFERLLEDFGTDMSWFKTMTSPSTGIAIL